MVVSFRSVGGLFFYLHRGAGVFVLVCANLTLVAGRSFAQTREYWECPGVYLKTEEQFKEERKPATMK